MRRILTTGMSGTGRSSTLTTASTPSSCSGAPAYVLLDRISARTRNDYGKSPEERELILTHLREVEPLLRRTCTHEIDASLPLADVAERVIRIGSGS